MRRIAFVGTSALAMLVATALPALAGSELPHDDGPNVFGNVVTPPNSTAFTGSDVFPWVLAVAVLLAVGLVLLRVSRRHLSETD